MDVDDKLIKCVVEDYIMVLVVVDWFIKVFMEDMIVVNIELVMVYLWVFENILEIIVFV